MVETTMLRLAFSSVLQVNVALITVWTVKHAVENSAGSEPHRTWMVL